MKRWQLQVISCPLSPLTPCGKYYYITDLTELCIDSAITPELCIDSAITPEATEVEVKGHFSHKVCTLIPYSVPFRIQHFTSYSCPSLQSTTCTSICATRINCSPQLSNYHNDHNNYIGTSLQGMVAKRECGHYTGCNVPSELKSAVCNTETQQGCMLIAINSQKATLFGRTV